MKATGIVRRIDDLGRVVIPKEIRRTMRIREGDPLEIFTDKEGGVVFRKYSQISELTDFAKEMCESLLKTTGQIAVITDRDTIIAVSGIPSRELLEKRISPQLEAILERRRLYQGNESEPAISVTEENEKYSVISASPVLSEGDVLGCVLFVAAEGGKRSAGEVEEKLLQTISGFLGRHMES